jgi:hypothetical protein
MSVPVVNTTQTRASTSGMMAAQAAPATKQGIGPVSASQRIETRRSGSTPPATVTSTPVVGSRIVAPKRTWVFVLGGILLAGGTAALVATLLTTGKADKEPAPAKPDAVAPGAPVTPAKGVGTVKFVTEPADAEIRIGDKLTHAGSPFSSELSAGIHQIEIHRAGYKSWLTSIELSANEVQTVRVVLEPLKNAAANSDATLTVNTTPAGLEVLVDGTPLAQKSPITTSLKVGPHSIVVRKDGVDVWRQNVNAEASSDYEFNPSFTADKQRERAKTPTPPAPAPTVRGSADPKPATESLTKSLIPAVVSGQRTEVPAGSAAAVTDGEPLVKP